MIAASDRAVDAELVRRCTAGDAAAWEAFYSRYQLHVRESVRAMLGPQARDRNLTDEIAQRVWYSLIPAKSRLHRYDPRKGSIKSFLFVIASQEVKLYLRSEWRRRTESLPYGDDGTTACSDPHITAAMLNDFLASLSERQRVFCETYLLSRTKRTWRRYSPVAIRKMTQRVFSRFVAFQAQ